MTKQIHPGEPSFDEVLMPDKIDIINALNFYAVHADDAAVKEWARLWCETRGLKVKLRGRTVGEMISYAAFYRMAQRGLVIDDDMASRLDAGFIALNVENEPSEEPVAAAKPKVAVHKPIECISKLDAYLDAVVTGEVSAGRVPNFCETRKDVSIITEQVKNRAAKLEVDKEGYTRESYKALKAAYVAITKSMATTAEKIATEKNKTVMKAKPASVIARDVKYSKEFGKIKGLLPEKMVGARKAYVFDKTDRKLNLFVATEAGFTFTGTTLKNFDTAKSFKKIIRKPEEVLEGLDMTMSQLNKTYGSINAKEQSVVGRFSEDHVILCIGGV